jgi:hypothetical protein
VLYTALLEQSPWFEAQPGIALRSLVIRGVGHCSHEYKFIEARVNEPRLGADALGVADLGTLSERPRCDFAKNRPQGYPANGWMKERRVEVDHVMMTASPLAQVDHAAAAQVADHTPDRALRKIKIARYFFYG